MLSLTNYELKYHAILLLNEVGGNADGAFKISHARIGKSGYSFGYMQWDYTAGRGTKTIADIMENAINSAGNKILTEDNIKDITKILSANTPSSSGSSVFPSDSTALETKLNLALSSTYGKNAIDTVHTKELREDIEHINDITATVNSNDASFFSTDMARLFLADFHNQYKLHTNGEMHKYITRGIYESPSSGVKNKFRGKKFGIDDLLSGLLHTKYANYTSIGDAVRRFSNVLSIAGYGLFTDEEAIGLVRIHKYLHSRGVGFSQIERQAIKNLFNSATNTLISRFGAGRTINNIVIGDDFDRKLVGNKNTLASDINHEKDDFLLEGTNSNDLIFGDKGDDELYGYSGSDVLYGGEDSDTIYGGSGNDIIIGGTGKDVIYGGADNDSLYAGKKKSFELSIDDGEQDYLDGGAGNDIYHVNDNDIITDDSTGAGSIIFDDNLLSGEKTLVKDTNGYLYEDSKYSYALENPNGTGKLTILEGTNDKGFTGKQIIVNKFNATKEGGYLGITLKKKHVDIYVGDATVVEGNKLEFTVGIDTELDYDLVLHVDSYFESGTGKAGYDDITMPADKTLTIKAGETSATYSVDTKLDGEEEPTETFAFAVTGIEEYHGQTDVDAYRGNDLGTFTIKNAGTGTIKDNDDKSTVYIDIASVSDYEGNAGGTNKLSFVVKSTRKLKIGETVTLDLNVYDIDTNSADYGELSQKQKAVNNILTCKLHVEQIIQNKKVV